MIPNGLAAGGVTGLATIIQAVGASRCLSLPVEMCIIDRCYNMKAERLGEDLMRELNTQVMLRVIDTRWMNYLQEICLLYTSRCV